MSEKQNSFECAQICWGIAAVVGLLLMIMLYMMAGFGGLQAFFTGLVIVLVLGFVLTLFVCRGQTAAADLAAEEKPAQRYAREAAEEKASREGSGGGAQTSGHAEHTETAGGHREAASHTEGAGSHTEAASHTEEPAAKGAGGGAAQPASLMSSGQGAVTASQSLPGQDELASRKGEWRYDGGDGSAAPATGKGSGGKTPPKDKGGKKSTKASGGKTPVSTEKVDEVQPSTLYPAPPPEGADDLKLISGVGPKLEQTLNDLGIYRFAQVADWGPSDIAWVDNRLKFKGRITRDDWMSQAKILAEGGETEFSARKKK